MTIDDSTAEKAWDEYAIPEGLVYNMPNSSERRAFMAGRASRDAEVDALRTQLAQRDRAMELRARRYDKLREQLAEAQATIEKVRAWNDNDATGFVALDVILSAPSSTGGESDV